MGITIYAFSCYIYIQCFMSYLIKKEIGYRALLKSKK